MFDIHSVHHFKMKWKVFLTCSKHFVLTTAHLTRIKNLFILLHLLFVIFVRAKMINAAREAVWHLNYFPTKREKKARSDGEWVWCMKGTIIELQYLSDTWTKSVAGKCQSSALLLFFVRMLRKKTHETTILWSFNVGVMPSEKK